MKIRNIIIFIGIFVFFFIAYLIVKKMLRIYLDHENPDINVNIPDIDYNVDG